MCAIATAPPNPPRYYVFRRGVCNGAALESTEVQTTEELAHDVEKQRKQRHLNACESILNVIRKADGSVPRKHFKYGTKDLIGVTQAEGEHLIEQMVFDGDLHIGEKKTSAGQSAATLTINKVADT